MNRTQGWAPSTEPLARSRDPQSSHDAARRAKAWDVHGRGHRVILDVLIRADKPLTCAQIARRGVRWFEFLEFDGEMGAVRVNRRMEELVRGGFVRKFEKTPDGDERRFCPYRKTLCNAYLIENQNTEEQPLLPL